MCERKGLKKNNNLRNCIYIMTYDFKTTMDQSRNIILICGMTSHYVIDQ